MAIYTNSSKSGTHGLEPEKLCFKWLQAPDILWKHYSDWNPTHNKTVSVHTTSKSKPNDPVIDRSRFRSWTKLLLALATIYNFLFRIKKERNNKEPYTADDINQEHSNLIRVS